ncbi:MULTISPECIES: amino acid ABC transporter ATP-binding protein [unclassified Mesorhizobium]|uniref:amino acid ABC transporter ATP-binding protein n=1 Tax=unclassified Mesorhizobium TaxID=325217 RepID=UPI0003CDDF7F|nr:MULTISPECIES: amino acid ABC transporter ATP-binding protein [unclassified Mesorhizobium]ESY54912.1 ABC transporter [Mesorhizobium sp. LNJC374B00]ESY55643.1 ABC transporter [Mesorhizobium sp. LNJC372A00]ESZ64994.1 ABC transporter [Mesorhizobium sp. L103C120A0]WJI46233.1 amino acid ABC transporter ATP-binding protein [Mesorhizobium sp. C120A]WJI82650.1 amino acid ABC transporter ATP-binding protein [Mesorhizobium sp. C374B]
MATSSNDNAALLDIAGVSKAFGSVEVLRAVSLKVDRGEVVTVIGPSGSGKTTLLRCVNFLESYDSGSIRIDGKEVGFREVGARKRRSERDLANMRAETGMVFQSFNLFPHLTAAGNIMLGLTKVRGKSKAEARQIAEHWLSRVGLAHKADSLPAELSGGQQQRVGIARAVAMEPKILLLDEITSALDPELVGEVLAVVRSLAEDGMTMVMVTHEMAFARDASSRIVFMADGGVSAVGPPKEILAEETTNERLRSFLARFRASHF